MMCQVAGDIDDDMCLGGAHIKPEESADAHKPEPRYPRTGTRSKHTHRRKSAISKGRRSHACSPPEGATPRKPWETTTMTERCPHTRPRNYDAWKLGVGGWESPANNAWPPSQISSLPGTGILLRRRPAQLGISSSEPWSPRHLRSQRNKKRAKLAHSSCRWDCDRCHLDRVQGEVVRNLPARAGSCCAMICHRRVLRHSGKQNAVAERARRRAVLQPHASNQGRRPLRRSPGQHPVHPRLTLRTAA